MGRYKPTNREKSRQPQRSGSWCPVCDAAIVFQGQRCPVCKTRIKPIRGKKRDALPPDSDLVDLRPLKW